MTTHPDAKSGASQKAEILAYIQEYGSITPLEAIVEIGCFRLGARIYDLKDDGHPIQTRMVEVPRKRRPGMARVAQYYLAAGGCKDLMTN